MNIQATYSAEDNKLRIYAEDRLDAETFATVKENGFKWAPVQKLFVAPKWTPCREDICIELAGSIEAEESTLLERAEAKAERLDNLAVKRAGQSDAYHDVVNRIAERFANGQPILIGHHSQRKAERDQEKIHAAMDRAVKAAEAVNYWNYKAESVEHHANRKNRSDVTARRIKTILAEMRSYQRYINDANHNLKMWLKIDAIENTEEKEKTATHYSGYHGVSPRDSWSDLQDGKTTPQEVINASINMHNNFLSNPFYHRCIAHCLGRLSYERSQLGTVKRFDGALTAVILQGFTRTQGADKPKATKNGDSWTIKSTVDLPAHISDNTEKTLTGDQWANLMQSCGYDVVTKEKRTGTKQTCSLINPTPEAAEKLQQLWNTYANGRTYGKPSEVLELTQARYSAISGGSYGSFETDKINTSGKRCATSYNATTEQKTPIFRVRVGNGAELYSASRVIIITDKPQKDLPLDLDALIKTAEAANSEKVAA